MNKIERKISLQPFNTFGVDVQADQLVRIATPAELQAVLRSNQLPVLILGGGSNVLFTEDVSALVLKNELLGKRVVAASAGEVLVEIGSGENWHQLVVWALERDFGGIENLSLIPGTVGAAPIQNIGAYGVELCDVFEKLEAVELSTGKQRIFYREDCQFGYRDSVFKHALKGQYFISRVFLRLTKAPCHQLNTSYGALRQKLQQLNLRQPTIQQISKAVVEIRESKLPDPTRLGNAGSFFKNPVLPAAKLEKLRSRFPKIVYYPAGAGRAKVPAGWLIEQCGWKGKRIGNTGCYEKQALVLVNYGGASGEEIHRLALRIIESVSDQFGIELEMEVNVWP